MSKDRNLGPLLIILTVLLVAVLGNWLKEHSWKGEPWNIGFTLELQAPDGEVVEGFPLDFVTQATDTKIKTSAKYRLSDDKGEAEVLSATYNTQAKIADIFGAYVNFLADKGYVVSKTEAQGGITNIVASSGNKTVSVSIYASTARLNEVRVDVRQPVIQ